MVSFVLLSGKMHADVHWKGSSRAIFHPPDGGGPASRPQWPTGLDQQPPERRPPAPLCHWSVHQLPEALFVISIVFVFS